MQYGQKLTLEQRAQVLELVIEKYETGSHTFEDCCAHAGIAKSTAYNWMHEYDSLKDRYKEAMKTMVDNRKQSSGELALIAMHRKLQGTRLKRTRHFKNKDGTIREVTYYEEHAPDSDLIKFVLTNAFPNQFRHSQHIESQHTETIEIIEEEYVPPKKTINIDNG